MNICIIGGGNVGTLMAAELSMSSQNRVTMCTSKVKKWSKSIKVIDREKGIEFYSKEILITSSMEEAISNSDIIFITTPSFMLKEILQRVGKYGKKGAYVGIIPGCGGAEFCAQELIDRGMVLFGLQRVHCISRLIEYGHSVMATGRKKELYVASIPRQYNKILSQTMKTLFKIPCIALDNYLNVTLTPSNPILHTTRLYEMFKHCTRSTEFEKQPLFYEQWDTGSSQVLIECDQELQRICNELDQLDLNNVQSLPLYYESKDKYALTNKIRSIEAFKGIKAPMECTANGKYAIDVESRYFTEDFPYGLCIIKAFGEITQVDTPNIDKIIVWVQKLLQKEYITDGKLNGRDTINLNIPQHCGISSKQDIYIYYS